MKDGEMVLGGLNMFSALTQWKALNNRSVRGRDDAQRVGCSEFKVPEVVQSMTVIRYKCNNSRLLKWSKEKGHWR